MGASSWPLAALKITKQTCRLPPCGASLPFSSLSALRAAYLSRMQVGASLSRFANGMSRTCCGCELRISDGTYLSSDSLRPHSPRPGLFTQIRRCSKIDDGQEHSGGPDVLAQCGRRLSTTTQTSDIQPFIFPFRAAGGRILHTMTLLALSAKPPAISNWALLSCSQTLMRKVCRRSLIIHRS